MKSSVWLIGLIVVLTICIRNAGTNRESTCPDIGTDAPAVGQAADAPGLDTDLKQGKIPLKTDDEVVQRYERSQSCDPMCLFSLQ